MEKSTSIDFDINNYTEKQLGDFLSYPCAGDTAEIGPDDSKYSIHYILKIGNAKHHIINMVCKEKTSQINQFTNKIENFIDKFNKLSKRKIEFVVEFNKLYSIPHLINSVKKEEIDQEIKNQIYSLFENFTYQIFLIVQSENILDVFDKKYKLVLLATLAHIYAEHSNNARVYSNEHYNKTVSVNADTVINLFDILADVKIDKKIANLTIDTYGIKS
jgi:hypothetical protein